MKTLRLCLVVLALAVLAGCPDPLAGDSETAGDGNVPTVGTMVFVLVPAGSFQRDATATNISVITQPYRMSQHEITRAQFLEVMGHDPSIVVTSPGTDHPVQNINWYHAITFCNKLSIREGLTPVYVVTGVDFVTIAFADVPVAVSHSAYSAWETVTADWSADGYRLPTNAEWTWAAMGADSATPGAVNTTGYAKEFAGDDGTNDVDDYVWHLGTSGSTGGPTRPVGSLEPNELGFYDMSGNVYEWCWDWDWWPAELPTETLTDYRGALAGSERLRRGGSYGDWRDAARIYDIRSAYPTSRNDHFGLRVVRR